MISVFSSEFERVSGFFTSPIPQSSKLFLSFIIAEIKDIFAYILKWVYPKSRLGLNYKNCQLQMVVFKKIAYWENVLGDLGIQKSKYICINAKTLAT